MKRNSNYQLQLALGLCLALPLSAPLLAEQHAPADTTDWVCKFCVISDGWFGDLEFGAIYVDDWSPKFGDYRGFDDDGFFIDLGGNASYRSEHGYFMDIYARDLGLDSRVIDVRGGKQGAFEWRASYNEIPRYMGYDSVTPYQGVGSDVLTLPASWSFNSAEASDFSLLDIDSKRKTAAAGIVVGLGSRWSIDADYERQTKEGTRAFSGGTFVVNAATFPAPLDYTTDLFTAGVGYAAPNTQLRLEFMGSDFDNGYDSVSWDNPIPFVPGDEVSRSALDPDNKFHQLVLSGAVQFGRNFRISGKVSSGTLEQNDPLLPYSTAPQYEDTPLPRDSLDAELETTMYNLSGRVYWRVAGNFDVTASYKSNERDNKTPVDLYTPILLEVLPRDEHANRPYSYDRSLARIDLRYRPGSDLRLAGGFRRDTLKRTYQAVRKSEEDTIWFEAALVTWHWMDARLKFDSGERTTSGYEDAFSFRADNPLMRKFHLAERDRNRVTVELDLMPSEKADLAFSYYATEDTYGESVIGLRESEERSFNIDFNYLLGKETSLYAFYSDETIDAEISGSPGANFDNWNSSTEDHIQTWGVGISGRISERLTYGFDYVSSDSTGDILTDSGAGEAAFPSLRADMQNARIFFNFQLNERWGLGLDAYHEKYDTADWYVDGYGPTDVAGLLSLGETSPDYSVNVVRLLATLRL